MYLHTTPDSAWDANRGSRSDPVSQAGRTTIVGNLITGLQKADKLIAVEPYMSYYHAAIESLLASPRLLIIGYGFSDLHINAWIDRMSRVHGGRLRVCILDYSKPWENTGYRMIPGWAVPSLVINKTAATDRLDFLHSGIISADPWTSENGRCRLDLRGFLATDQQADEVAGFLC